VSSCSAAAPCINTPCSTSCSACCAALAIIVTQPVVHLAECVQGKSRPPELVGCVCVAQCALAPVELMVLYGVALDQGSSLRHGDT
jgi:hypothetical protein